MTSGSNGQPAWIRPDNPPTWLADAWTESLPLQADGTRQWPPIRPAYGSPSMYAMLARANEELRQVMATPTLFQRWPSTPCGLSDA